MKSYGSWRHPSWLKDKQTHLLSKVDCFFPTIKTTFCSYIQWLFWSWFPTGGSDGGRDFIILSSPELTPLVAQYEPAMPLATKRADSVPGCFTAVQLAVLYLPHTCTWYRLRPSPCHLVLPKLPQPAPSVSQSWWMTPASLLSIKTEIWQLSVDGRDKWKPCPFEAPSKPNPCSKILIPLPSFWSLSFPTSTVKTAFPSLLSKI